MATLKYVKAAQKNYPEQGIKKGEQYWWIKDYRSPKRFFKTRPFPSQYLSGFAGSMASIEERIAELSADSSREDLREEAMAIVEELRNLSSEEQDKFDNMPEGFQQGDTGQRIESRVSACEDMAGEIEQFADELEESEADAPLADIISNLQGVTYGGE